MKQREFKEKMPGVAAGVEQFIALLGVDYVHGEIRAALNGAPSSFFGSEAGYTIGKRNTEATAAIHYDERGISYAVELEWLEEARVSAQRHGINIMRATPGNVRDVEREANELRKIIAMNKGV